MKVYAYLRVSTEHQDFQQQTNAINLFLQHKGLKIDEVYSDEGVSGGVSYKKRKLNGLLNVMNQGDVLVVSEISRLGRSMSDLNKLVNDDMKVRKLRLIVVNMGLDLDCANLKAIDEMILFAFSFSSQIEKEMIQERTRNALDARRRMIEEKGHFVSKSGRVCTKLGGGAMTEEARLKSREILMRRAASEPKNVFFARYIKTWEDRNGKLTASSNRSDFASIAKELNMLGMKTATGLEYTANRVRALWTKMKNREYLLIEKEE